MKTLTTIIGLLIALSAAASANDVGAIAIAKCPGTTGMCLRAVRIAIQTAKGMSLKGDVLYAKDFGPVLENKYKATLLPVADPRKAPIGAIIVYSSARGSRNPAGHVEIKTRIGYVSDHISKRPYNGPVRGIYLL